MAYESYIAPVPAFNQGLLGTAGIGSAAAAGAQQPLTPGLQEVLQGALNGGGGLDALLTAASPYGQGARDRVVAAFNAAGPQGFMQQITGGATGAAGGGNDLTVIGQQTPEQIARNNAIMNRQVGGTSGGSVSSGGGGSGSGAPETSNGGLFSAGSNAPPANNAPSFGQLQAPTQQPTGYQSPIAQNNTGGFSGAAPTFNAPNNQLPNGQQAGQLQMQQTSPQAALNNYFNTPGYQLLFGQGAQQRFQSSPGYQFAVNEALGQVQGNASARGLLESGRVMRDMTDRAYGMANQEYNNWQGQQSAMYGDYQNRLAGLAAGPTGAEQANQMGQNLGGMSMQTGSNLANLFGNQGNAGLGAFTNTGAAQANSMQQAANTQLQVGSANNSSLLSGALLANQGKF